MSGPRWHKQYKDREDVIAKGDSYLLNDFDWLEENERKNLANFWQIPVSNVIPPTTAMERTGEKNI